MSRPSSTTKSVSKIRLALVGASGRMGEKILEVLRDPADRIGQDFSLVWQGSVRHPKDLTALVESGADILVDFSKPQGTLTWVRAFAKATKSPRPAALICATGFDVSELKFLKSSLKSWTWAHVPNTSLGVYALAESLKLLARTLPEDYSFSVHESHHAKKVDSPSGTGLFLKNTIQELRPKGQTVEVTSVRGGTDPGTHTVTILGPLEKITLTHAAEDRRLFARGALVLARSLNKTNKKGQLELADLAEG